MGVHAKGFDYEITVEEWVLPDESDLVELSVKAPPGDAGVASDEFLSFLRGRGFDTEADQQTKTRGVASASGWPDCHPETLGALPSPSTWPISHQEHIWPTVHPQGAAYRSIDCRQESLGERLAK